MFSGIVQGVGKVTKVKNKKGNLSIEIAPPKSFNKGLKKGASISVDGICLTSLYYVFNYFIFDGIVETLFLTNLKNI